MAKARRSTDSRFHTVPSMESNTDLMYQYLGKGSLIGVEGRIQTRNYDGKDGKKVYITEVVVDRVEFLESRKNEDDYEQQSNEPYRQAPELEYRF